MSNNKKWQYFHLAVKSKVQCKECIDKSEQIDSCTIHGNVECVHSQYSCILKSQVSIQLFCPTKLLITVTILE